VVIPTHQRRDLLLQVLAALAVQTIDRERFDVTVVCDGCRDGSATAAQQAATDGAAAGLILRALDQPHAGAATARNHGARQSTGDLLLFLDDDMIAAPDLLAVHLEEHFAHPGGIVLGNLPVHPESPPSYLTTGLQRWAERRNRRLSRADGPLPPDEVLTGQMSMSRQTFDLLGGFDTRFTAGGTFGGEDIELGWRARHRGISVRYAATAVSQQVYRKTFAALCRNIRDSGAADSLMAATHPVRPHLPLGQVDGLPLLQRLTLRATLRAPALWGAIFRPLLGVLDRAAAGGRQGRIFEHLHGIARAHLYGLGMGDGAAAAASSRTA
jgi:hypothetical protein